MHKIIIRNHKKIYKKSIFLKILNILILNMKEVDKMKKILSSITIMFIMFFTTSYLSVNAYGFGFTRNDNHKTPEIGKYKTILENTLSEKYCFPLIHPNAIECNLCKS